MRRLLFSLLLVPTLVSCRGTPAHPVAVPQDRARQWEPAPAEPREWFGVYASPREVGGFTGTVLLLRKGISDDVVYRMRFYTDVVSTDAIPQDELSGNCLIEGDRIYLPQAFGHVHDQRPQLSARVERYRRVRINDRVVLMRDDAFDALAKHDELYDYGILIKVSDQGGLGADLESVEHPSIKLLYKEGSTSWHDPFVHEPNRR